MKNQVVFKVVFTLFIVTVSVGLSAGRSVAEEGRVYAMPFDAANFEQPAENAWFPMKPGMKWEYRELDDEGEVEAQVIVEVTGATRTILGVQCLVIHDRVYEEKKLVEDTLDYYASDRFGNVWYFGEDSRDYERGKIVSIKGSWLAGAEGAMPGLFLAAEPEAGMIFRQEVSPGKAEDMAEVEAKDASAQVRAGKYESCLRIKEWNPLEPGVVEYKYYARGTGVVLEEEPAAKARVELYKHK